MINFIKRKILKKKTKETFKEYGFELKKFTLKKIGEIEYAQWLHPFEEIKVISDVNISFYQKICKKGDTIVDIGAHTGDTTVPMALCVEKEGLVIGVEPNKYVYKILEKNATLNKAHTNIVPLCFAATDIDGTFTFNYSDASFCNGGFLSQIESKKHKHDYTLAVVGKNLQNFLFNNYQKELERLSLIKIDAEGYDKEILKTIPKILNDYKPALMLECYQRLNSAERAELFDVVKSHGYQLFYLENFESLDQLRELQSQNMEDYKHFEILALHKSKKEMYNIDY